MSKMANVSARGRDAIRGGFFMRKLIVLLALSGRRDSDIGPASWRDHG